MSKTNYLIQENIKVYPNPAKYELNIELPFNDEQNIEIYLYNQAGAIVKIINPEYNLSEINIPLYNIENGIYTLVIKRKEDLYCKRIIKMN